jgi:hypothetical protein
MFNPTKCSKPFADRLLRWGIELREFNYVIQHIPWEVNCCADILSRCVSAHDLKYAPSVTLNVIETVESNHQDDIIIQSIDQ